MASFFGELRRRNVVRVAVAYAIVGWLLIEVASVLMPTFQAPEWVMRVFSFFVIAGFPVALVLALGFVVYNYESEDAPASNPEANLDEVAYTPRIAHRSPKKLGHVFRYTNLLGEWQ